MSYETEKNIKVCCSSGTPEANRGCEDYEPSGSVISLSADLKAYATAPSDRPPCTQTAIILIYDIFGLDIMNTRRFADTLSHELGCSVLMPDFFRGKPWRLDNFPPARMSDLMSWIENDGSWDVISKDLETSYQWLTRNGVQTNSQLGLVGFCWGGKQVLLASSRQKQRELGINVSASVIVHGSWLSCEDAKGVDIPMAIFPSGDDPDVEPLKRVFDEKPIGGECVYQRFPSEQHGFATARGNWKNENTRKAILTILEMSTMFFKKHLPFEHE